MSDIDKVTAFAHELGHVIEYVEDYKKDAEFWKLVNSPSTLLWREQTAWRNAVTLLQEVVFMDWKAFTKNVSDAMGSYYSIWEAYVRIMIRYKKERPIMSFSPKVLFLQALKRKIQEEMENAI